MLFIADVFRRLPLLLLVVLLLLLVVFHVCIIGSLPRRGRKRRSLKNNDRMEGRQAISGSAGEHGGRWSRHSPSNSPRPSERSGYAHLPPHLQPLPDMDDEEGDDRRSRPVPLGSGSTQEWAGTELFGGREGCKGQSYTELLQQGLIDTDGDGGVNLSFGLGSGRSAAVSRTVIVTPHPDDDGGDVTVVVNPHPDDDGGDVTISDHPGLQRRCGRLRGTTRILRGSNFGRRLCVGVPPLAPSGCSLRLPCPPVRVQAAVLASVGRRRVALVMLVTHVTEGRCGQNSDGKTGTTARTQWGTRTTPNGTTTALKVGRTTQATFRRRSSQPLWEVGTGRRSRVAAMVVGTKGRQARAAMSKVTLMVKEVVTSGSVDDIIALIRAKSDQKAHLQGMGDAYARMKPREWKWLDVATRLKKVGVEREADRCGKKWDNLMQQFKKVHHFQGLSGKQDVFQLSGKDRMSKGFSFNVDRAVYDEILGSTAKNHTINPKNITDTGAQGGVRLPSASSVDPECVGDEHNDDDDGSTKGSSQTTSGAGGFDKRKSTRQQTFEAMIDCMEKHGALMVSTIESNNKRHCSIAIRQCEVLEVEIEVQKKHYAASDEVNKLMCHALLEIAKAIGKLVFGDILIDEHIFSPVVFTAIVAFPNIVSSPSSSRLSSLPRPSSNTTPTPPSLLTVGLDNAVHVIEAKRVNKLVVGVFCAMSSRGSACGKAAANLAQQPPTREKKGRRMANEKRKILQGASAHGGYVVDEDLVPEDVATQKGTDFEDSDDMPLQRKSSRRGSGGLRIDDAGDRRCAGGRAAPEDVLDVDAATAAREGGGNRAPLPRMTPPTDTQERVVRLRTPLTPRSRTAADVVVSGGASQAAKGVRAGGAAVGVARAGYAAGGGGSNAGKGATTGVKAGDVAGEGDDDEALVNRLRQRNTREGMEAAAKLWVDDLRFWNEREGFVIVKLIVEVHGYLVAVAREEQPPPIRRSIILPHNNIPQHKIADESELNAAKERALKNRQRGYHAAYQYALNRAATDIARAMWMGEDWRYCVSLMVVHHTLDMDMKLPLWFMGTDVEDRQEDDGLAAYQEASIQRLLGAFTSAVIIAEATDGGRVSHERLKTMADAMRMMLAATMWLMRMAGDDHRAHYDAWVFVQLTAKPTLVPSMHRCFDVHRHIVQAAIVITDKLASPPITLIDSPMYVPDKASIGVKFSHDATLSSPMEAKKMDGLGTGPPEDEDDRERRQTGKRGGR
ncbi:hypothetical protein CBR_g435 [Chara braunii]|uniref:Myb/SANT-like DNA-binding domain-containing protein n=1 Tax=Chara braunii TaxID=69332 RepID=A0A388KBB8_CHABU|nr:hypothetical protein CBR_g435 [Chara braunii]|eukprot:GBG67296.1 hypothetical protein CBR_g435 [Chara braunii]